VALDCYLRKGTGKGDSTMSTATETVWTVQFVGDYFTLTTTVIAEEEDQAIENATAWLFDRHGFNLDNEVNDVNAWETAQ